ncbi:MAG: hypothetical protein HY677_07180 [Chloroflexi bacterium]|nr:hypothetical protein [Chloroflexota bacterium]
MSVFMGPVQTIHAAAKAAVFFLKLYPMLPSRPLDWVTAPPVVERARYPTPHGEVEGDLYRPGTGGPHPGLVVCLGAVPFEADHPQVPRLGAALARSGFAALLYWSPAMRDLRLDPDDIEAIASAYQWLIERPDVDPARAGLLGTCVGASFALMAATSPRIRDRVTFIAGYAPYSSMWTLARDIASGTRSLADARASWQVDPLTRKVYVRSLTALLEPREAELLRIATADQGGHVDSRELSEDGRAVYKLLTKLDADEAEDALRRLPVAMQERLTTLSPIDYLEDVRASLIILLHDRDDIVIPVTESRRLWSALAGREGVRYTEFSVFQHLDPTKGKPPLFRLVPELARFYLAVYPLFRHVVAA